MVKSAHIVKPTLVKQRKSDKKRQWKQSIARREIATLKKTLRKKGTQSHGNVTLKLMLFAALWIVELIGKLSGKN